MSLHLYRPQKTPPDLLSRISVGRGPLLQEIFERLDRWRPGSSRQHYLLIGPRGIGKTHLLHVIAHQIRSDAGLRDKWIPILLAEENYGISKVSDLFIEMLRRLVEDCGMSSVAEVYEDTRFDDDDQRVCDRCLDAFRRIYRETSRGVLLMMENIDRILERQVRPRSEIHKLRRVLIEEDWLVTICTSPTYLNAVSQPEEPFFEFFDVRPLAELTADEQLEMLRNLATEEGSSEVICDVEKHRSRLRALYHFTGGSPRLTVMLFDLVAHHQVGTVKHELDILLDQLTPFYQDRMKEVSELEAKLLECLALLPEGYTPTELAAEARMDAKIVRATLTRLERSGYVRREERRKKRTVYIVPERLFRIWHQMNHSRSARGRVQYLLEFFSSWYSTPEERDEVWEELISSLEESADDTYHIPVYMDYLAAVSEGDERLERSFGRLNAMIHTGLVEAFEEELGRLDKEYGDDGRYLLHKGYFLAHELGRIEPLIRCLEDTSSDVRSSAAKALGRLGDRAAVGPLLRCLEDTSSHVRSSAAKALGRLGDRAAVEPLLRRLEDTASHVRASAAAALGHLGDRAAVEPLIRCLEDTASNVRASYATALGRLGDPTSVSPLVCLLEDSAANARNSAAIALGRIAEFISTDQLKDVVRIVIDSSTQTRHPLMIIPKVVSNLLKSVLQLNNASVIVEAIQTISDELSSRGISSPHQIAADYLSSDKDPAVLERQQPEIREAVLLLVDSIERRTE